MRLVHLQCISRAVWASRENGAGSPAQTACGSAYVHRAGRRSRCRLPPWLPLEELERSLGSVR